MAEGLICLANWRRPVLSIVPSQITFDTLLVMQSAPGRRARLIELDPKYVDVVVQRWQEQTGQSARLKQSGQSFSEMASKKMALPSEG